MASREGVETKGVEATSVGRFRRRGPILNEEEDESVLLPREEESDAAMGGGPRERDVGCGSARPTDQRYTVARRDGERERAIAAPWNGLDGYAAGLGPPAMDGWPNGALVSYKNS